MVESIELQLKKTLQRCLQGVGIDAVEELQRTVPYATGFLASHIDYVVDELSLTITMPEYAKYVEYGHVPYFPPIEEIVSWCKVKGIPEEAAYPIAVNISKYGTRPQPFIRPFINNKLEDVFAENFK